MVWTHLGVEFGGFIGKSGRYGLILWWDLGWVLANQGGMDTFERNWGSIVMTEPRGNWQMSVSVMPSSEL